MAAFLVSVDEEANGEDGFTVAPEFGCDGQVVFSSSELVAEIDELLRKELGKRVNLNTGVQVIQDTDILEAGLVEVVVGSEKEIGCVLSK